MYTVTINATTFFRNLRLNGDNFISNAEIKDSDFPESPFTVVISDGERKTTIENTELAQVKQYGDEWWFVLRKIPAEELERKTMISQIQMLEELLDALMEGIEDA